MDGEKFKILVELVHRDYLSGWEILHYENLLKKIDDAENRDDTLQG